MTEVEARAAVPVGRLVTLRPSALRVNPNNPRRLFDPEPLRDLKENIRQHGVLVPLTVFPVPGQDVFEILDGQRRYQCCLDLEAEGEKVEVPANVVEVPTKLAGLLYMFNIHNYRQPWELMPTALGLKIVMEELGTTDTSRLAHLTGLNEKSVERCKLILSFPEKYQALSLAPDPIERVPSNFWIEASPVVSLIKTQIPDLYGELGEDGILDRLVDKYRSRKIRSVIHFRRIIEAYETAEAARAQVLDSLRIFVLEPSAETRQVFDPFVADNRRVETAIRACTDFVATLRRSQLEHLSDDRAGLREALQVVRATVDALLINLEGGDDPAETRE